LSWCAN